MDRYVDVLCRHLAEISGQTTAHLVDSIYFGGGTPSYLGEKRLCRLLKAVYKHYHVSKDAEVTVEANPDKEYPAFQKNSPVTSVFKAFLPDYYQQRKNGVISDLKNLYRMAGDLAFTNTSVKNVMEVLKPGFRVKDAVTSGNRYGAYFTESYQQNILLRDRVLEVDEYKERMKGLLQQMAQEEISLREFRHRLEELVEYRFITEDFADYFLEYRAKLDLAKAGQK